MSIFPKTLLTTDAHQYTILAQNILNGQGFTLSGNPEIIFPPGYSFLIMPFLLFLDPNTAVLTLMFLSLLSLSFAVFLLTKKYTNTVAGIIASLAIGLNGNLLLSTLLGLTEIIMFAVLLFSMYFFDVTNKRRLLMSGVLLGIAYLVKPEAILYMGIFIFLTFLKERFKINKKLLAFVIPVMLCIISYSSYLYSVTGKIAISGKVATLEWDMYIEDKSISRESVIYRLNPDMTLGPSLKEYSVSRVNFYKRGLVNLMALKQSMFELLLPLKITLGALVLSFIFWKKYFKFFTAVILLNIPIALTFLFHIENRYLFSLLITVLIVLSVSASQLFQTKNLIKKPILLSVSLSSLVCLLLVTYYSYYPLRADLPDLIKQQIQAEKFLNDNQVNSDIIVSRKPHYSFLAKKNYYPLPYTNDPKVLMEFLDRFPNATIILDRWDYFTLPEVHKMIREDYESGQKIIVKEKKVLVLENW